MTKYEKIEILTEVLNIYKNEITYYCNIGMCYNLEKIISKQIKETPEKGIYYYIPEFCRHEKYGQPVLWFKKFDHESRINYLLETIKIIEIINP